MEVARRGHHLQGGIQEGKNQGTKTKQTRATTYNMRRARKATISMVQDSPDRKTKQGQGQRNKMKEEGKGYSNEIKYGKR